jgi:hypothetical protein
MTINGPKLVLCILFIISLNIFLPNAGIPVNALGAMIIGCVSYLLFPWIE